jgi:hypothetical protein
VRSEERGARSEGWRNKGEEYLVVFRNNNQLGVVVRIPFHARNWFVMECEVCNRSVSVLMVTREEERKGEV